MILLDTNILARAVEPTDKDYMTAVTAMAALRARGDILCLVPQAFYELWVLSTRPVVNNGRGRTPAETADEFAQLKSRFLVLADSPAIFDEWERLVTTLGIIGKQAHDARFAAAMKTHGLTRLLTFNTADFARYPGITILDPRAVATTSPMSAAP